MATIIPSSLAALIAALPILITLILLAGLMWPAKRVMPLSWLSAVLLGLLIWRMDLNRVLAASLEGFLGALNIMIIVFGAILLMNTLKNSGSLNVISQVFYQISKDRRVQAIIIGWMFSSFIEGAAGFGTPAALAAPLLVGIGLPPLAEARITVMFNSTAVVFGAVGTTIMVGIGTSVDGLLGAEQALSTLLHHTGVWASIINSVFGSIMPLFAICLMTRYFGKNRSFREGFKVAPFALLAGFSFTIPSIIIAYFLGPELPSVISGALGLVILITAARKGYLIPQEEWDFPEPGTAKGHLNWGSQVEQPLPQGKEQMSLLRAILPYLLVILILVITRLPFLGIRQYLTGWTVSWLNILGEQGVSYSFQPLYIPGIIPFILVALLTWKLHNMSLKSVKQAWSTTLIQVKPAAVALLFAVAMVRILVQSWDNSSGLASMLLTMSAYAAEQIGSAWPLFSPLLGVLGAFVSGSNTVSNLLFAGFQFGVAETLNISRTLTLSLQTVGGAIGNMICIHNIVAVCAVVGIIGSEGLIVKHNIIPALLYAFTVGIIGYLLINLSLVAIY